MNAIEDNPWTRAFQALGAELPRPRAILSISAHWWVDGTFTTGDAQPRTIHDFGGFPEPLYRMQYPAPGDPQLAARVAAAIGNAGSVSLEWGLDHGTWTVLHHLRPGADVPVVQLSIDRRLPAARHLELGRALAPLRDEGVLILGSGNITHNLRHAFASMQSGDRSTPPWAADFDAGVARALTTHDDAWLAEAPQTHDGRLCHPSPDHYLPLLYAAGAAGRSSAVRFPITGFDLGSLSMRAVLFT